MNTIYLDQPEQSDQQATIEMITVTQLKQRGWTAAAMTRFAPEPDKTSPNPYYRSGSPMKLFDLARIETIEMTPEFQEWKAKSEGRRQGAAKAVGTKELKMKQCVASKKIKVSRMPIEKLQQRARAHYEKRLFDWENATGPISGVSEGYLPLDSEQDRRFEERIAVNHLRHVCTRYDRILEDVSGKTGQQIAYELLSRRVFREIAITYPHLRSECHRQYALRFEEEFEDDGVGEKATGEETTGEEGQV